MNQEKLILENKNMIYKIASRYSSCYDIDDLFQVGAIGLIEASKHYDSSLNVKFSTYAFKYILGEISKFIKNDRNIKVSVEYLKIYRSYNKAKDLLQQKYGRQVSDFEISEFMNIDIILLNDVIKSVEFTLSFENDLTYNSYAVDNTNELDMREDINSSIEKLDEITKKIIEFRYYKDYSQSETAKALGLSQAKVSRKENYALKYIKKEIVSIIIFVISIIFSVSI